MMESETWQKPHLAMLAADVVLFARGADGVLYVLLIERGDDPFAGCWALPGGLVDVDKHETFEQAARRELVEETDITAPDRFIEVGTFHDPARDPRRRVVTTAFTGELPGLVKPTAGDDAAKAMWHPVADVLYGPLALAFDHFAIVHAAYDVLQTRRA